LRAVSCVSETEVVAQHTAPGKIGLQASRDQRDWQKQSGIAALQSQAPGLSHLL